MTGSPVVIDMTFDKRELEPLMARYAMRYYIAGPERDALVAQTLAVLAHDPDLIFDQPAEKAVAITMHRIFRNNIETVCHPALKTVPAGT